MKSRLLKIDDIKINPNIYPRDALAQSVVDAYKMAMDGGEVFPPILVGTIDGDRRTHHLIDGRHRMAANKRRGEAYISADIRHFENAKDAFMEAVRLNTKHGAPLSWDDRAKAMKKLMTWGIEKERILKIVRIPTSEMFRVKAATSPFVKTTHRGKSRRDPSIEPSSSSPPSPSSSTYPDSPVIHDDQIGFSTLEHLYDFLVTGRLNVKKPKIADLSRRVWELLGEKLGVKA